MWGYNGNSNIPYLWTPNETNTYINSLFLHTNTHRHTLIQQQIVYACMYINLYIDKNNDNKQNLF